MINPLRRATPVLALLLIVGLGAPAAAQLVDAQLVAGNGFSGQLDAADDMDIVALEGLTAELVTIQVSGEKGGPSDLLVDVIDVTNDTTIATATGSKIKINKLELPGTGIYNVCISSPSGQLGPYKVKTKGKPDKAGLQPDSAPSGSGFPGSIEIKFDGRKGMELKAKVKPQKKTQAAAGGATLTGPNGPVDLSAYMKVKKGKLSLKKVPIDAFGEWTLFVPNFGVGGTLEAKTSLKSKVKGDVAENDYEFGGALTLTPDLAFVGEFTQGTALIALTSDDTIANDVALVRVTDDGEEFVAKLFDDGILGGNGDEIEGDRVFTGGFNFTPAEEGTEVFRVVAGFGVGGKARSLGVDVLSVVEPSDAELNNAIDHAADMQALVDQAVLDGTLAATLAAMLADLQADPTIVEVGYSDGQTGLWMVDENGIPSAVYAPVDGVKAGGDLFGDGALAPVISERGLPLMPIIPGLDRNVDWAPYDAFFDSPKPIAPPVGDGYYAAAAPENLIESNKVFGIAAQYWDWGEGDDIPKMVKTFQDNKCFETTYVKYTADGNGDVNDFKNLGNYGVVLVSSHGDSFYAQAAAGSKFGWNNTAQGIVVLHSNQKITLANLKLHIKDVLKGRLVIWGDNYGMTPTFITTYSGKMPNTLVYMSICRGTFNATLSNAFIGAGAGAFLGYSDYVAVSFCEANGPPMLDKLLMPDNTLDDAFTAGIVETDSDPAEFKLFGSKTLKIKPGLKDGSFEAGNLNAAWTTAGDARLLGGLGGYGPTDGTRVAIISTGLGFTTSSGSFCQTICLGDKDDTLSFDWVYFSEEFLEYCDSQFQDTFQVKVQDVEGGGTTVLFSKIVDDLCGSVSPASVSFDQGDVHVTSWKTQKVKIPKELKGKKVKVTFECFDVGDSIYDTAVLVDNITLK